jgi:hypothetical protein
MDRAAVDCIVLDAQRRTDASGNASATAAGDALHARGVVACDRNAALFQRAIGFLPSAAMPA